MTMRIYHSAPDPTAADARIPDSDLPRCHKCEGLLRPGVVWFGEALDHNVLLQAGKANRLASTEFSIKITDCC